MGEIDAGGLLEFWNKSLLNPRGLKMKLEKIGPQAWTMERFLIGFQLCLVALTIASIAFGIEIIIALVIKTAQLRLVLTEVELLICARKLYWNRCTKYSHPRKDTSLKMFNVLNICLCLSCSFKDRKSS